MSYTTWRSAAWALVMYIQANTNDEVKKLAVRNLGSRGLLLDDAMADLADEVKIGWYRDSGGVWQYDERRKVNEMPAGVWRPADPSV